MEPTLTWLDLTATDRDKMRRALDLFNEQGTIDEMGLGTLRDTVSDALFPGTSTLQTRLRYMLFVPWIYQRLEHSRTPGEQVVQKAREAELRLIEPLLVSGDYDGVIGARSRNSLGRLPSNAYWTGLVRWGIFMHRQSQSWYHSHFDNVANGGRSVEHADDPGVIWSREPAWHQRLPKPPPSFPRVASFALTRDEAEFLQGRIAERCDGTLLAWLAYEGSDSPADSFWDDPDVEKSSDHIQGRVELARRFSLHVEGMPLLYNLLLAERHREKFGEDKGLIDSYRADIAEWEEREGEEPPYDPNAMWTFVIRLGTRPPAPQRNFVESWSSRLAKNGVGGTADDDFLRKLIADREWQLKRNRARLVNLKRLRDWNGRVGVGRMDFRWFRIRQLLTDLHQGLGQTT